MKPVLLPIRGRQAALHQVNNDVVLYVKPDSSETEPETRSYTNSAIAEGASEYIFQVHGLDPYNAVSVSGVNGEGWYALIEWKDTELVRPTVKTTPQSEPEPKTSITLIELIVGSAAVAAVGFGLWKLFK